MLYTLIVIVGLIIIAFALIVFLRKDNTISLEQAINLNQTENSHYFEFANQKFHYIEKGSGELIILFHGIGDSFIVFNELSSLLAEKYQVIAIDLPGFGLSEVPNFTDNNDDIIQFYRDFFDAFLKHKNIEEFHLAGNSLGGLVAWDWAVNNTTFKLKSLCLIASAGFDMNKIRKNVSQGVLDKLPQFLLTKGAPLKISELSAATCIVDKTKINKAFINAHHSMINKKGTVSFFVKLLFNSFQPQVDKLAELNTPTLIVWGSKDKIIPVSHAHQFQNTIKNSKLITYKNVGHYPQIEKADQLAEDWMKFTNEILS